MMQNPYTLDYRNQCAAWTRNIHGPARKQCELSPNHNIDGWIYLCYRHYDIITREIEREIDTTNSRRVANLQARVDIAELRVAGLEPDPKPFDIEDYEARRKAQTVYFIRCEQYLKIGISYEPTIRLNQIRKGGGSLFPKRMDVTAAELVATEPGGFDREKELHAKFARLRHTGEWFTEAPELTEYIDSLTKAA